MTQFLQNQSSPGPKLKEISFLECPKAVPPIHWRQKTTVLIGIEICFAFMFFTEEA